MIYQNHHIAYHWSYPQHYALRTILLHLSYNAFARTLESMEPGNRPIPNRLQMHRKLMRYTPAQVAQLLGLSNGTLLSQWERGDKLPTTINLIKLSIIYRTYPNELYPEYFSEQLKELRQQEKTLFNLQ